MRLGPYELPGVYVGDAGEMLRQLPPSSIHCCITSPPYWNLRSYLAPNNVNKAKEIGAEPTPEEYVANLVEVFREVRRVLREDGTCWLNLGDCYAGTGKSGGGIQGEKWADHGAQAVGPRGGCWSPPPPGLKPKDLCLIPYRVALELQSDGWYLRSHIVWAKGLSFCKGHSGSPMPESVRDRPTVAHEAVFLLAKSESYYYDSEAAREPDVGAMAGKSSIPSTPGGGRNLRNVWAISPRPYQESHYAVFPPQLVAPMLRAGCPPDGVVLDPFVGSGTTGQVAQDHGRLWIGFDLDERNVPLVKKRTAQTSLLGCLDG